MSSRWGWIYSMYFRHKWYWWRLRLWRCWLGWFCWSLEFTWAV